MVSRSPDNSRLFPSKLFVRDLCRRITRQQYDIWFEETRFDFVPPDRIVISVPNRFHKKWVEANYLEAILLSARSVFNFEPDIEIQSPDEKPSMPVNRRDRGVVITEPANRLKPDPSLSSPVNREHTFDSFVVGPSNRLAVAACLAVSENDVGIYNPLIIHGDTALGKSHLLQAAFLEFGRTELRHPMYTTCDDFIHLSRIHSRTRERADYRSRLRPFDVLIVDDIHVLARHEKYQTEFFHILNDFLSEEKQVIVSCCDHPKSLAGLSERILSRLQQGLVTRLDLPCFELRVNILKRKAARLGLKLSDEIAETLARGFGRTPRDLEGIARQLLSLGRVQNLGPESLKEIPDFYELLQGLDIDQAIPKSIEFTDILRIVASYFSKKRSDIVSSSREKSVARSRQIAMYLSRELTQHSYEEIGAFFGGRDHATVIHSVNKIRRLKDTDPTVKRDLLRLSDRLQRR